MYSIYLYCTHMMCTNLELFWIYFLDFKIFKTSDLEARLLRLRPDTALTTVCQTTTPSTSQPPSG